MVIVRSTGRWMEGGDSVKVQQKVFSVADGGVALVPRDPDFTGRAREGEKGNRIRGNTGCCIYEDDNCA